MAAIASQITSLTIVYSTVYSDADQRKHQSSTSLAFVRGIHRGLMNSPHKWPVSGKCFHLMMSSWSRHCFVPRTFLSWHSYAMSSHFCRMSCSFIQICFSVSRDNVCGTFPSIMWLKTPYCHSCFWPLNFHIRATCFKFPQKIHSTKKGRVYEWQNAWWWHDMETFSTLLTFCEGNPLEQVIPSQRASNVELWCFLCCYLEQVV